MRRQTMCHTGECGCGHQAHHSPHGTGHHQGCCGGGFGHRRFFTREEIIAQLEEYLDSHKAEVKGLEEHIAGLKK
jgi:tRNA-Thr(GGU) m(6)t(6)A37 methyltransferase TsaA